MKFGIGPYTALRAPDEMKTQTAKYRETIEMTQVAENVGFDAAWVSEHHGGGGQWITAPLSFLCALAQATSRITLGTDITVATFYEPIKLAEQAATVDVLSGGRFKLGLGAGYRDHEFDRYFQLPKSERVPRLKDCIEVCRRGWEGGQFSYDGDVFSFDDVRVDPVPVQGADIPILYGATSEPALRRAVRIADGIHVPFLEPEDLQDIVDLVLDEGADPEEFEIKIFHLVYVDDDEETAWERIKDGYNYFMTEIHEGQDESSDDIIVGPGPGGSDFEDIWSLMGSPETVVDKIEHYTEPLAPFGDNAELICWFDLPFMDHEATLSSIRRFGGEVIPNVDIES